MSNRLRDLIRIEGYLLFVLVIAMSFPFIMALSMNERDAASAFFMVIMPCLIAGLIIIKFVNPSPSKIKARDGFLVVSLSWILSSLLGALPMFLSGAIPNYIDAFFESCSGFTTTGASILTDIESLPRSILFWRSEAHWLGGMGILVFIMALLPTLGISGQVVANAETPGPTKDKITAKFSDTAKDLYLIYIIMTVTETLLLKLGGLSWYDAVLHTFGTVGTGGFSCYNDSIGHFNSPYVEWVIILFMILAGVNFNLFYMTRRDGLRRIFKDDESRFYFSVIGIASLGIFLCLMAYDYAGGIGETFRDTVFQVVSVLTTTGYMTDDFNLWPTFAKMALFTLFFIGGCSSSTSGGIKCVRILISMKLVRRGISIKLHPHRIAQVMFNRRELSNNVVIHITNFIFTYLLLLAVGFLMISLDGFDFMSSFSAAATCLGNIGPGFETFGPTMNFSVMSGGAKLVCSFLMLFGRLELFTMLVLFSKYYWNSNRTH
ncbi:MAG: TrkH family potassium uptake protein [Firmicutes bacterium]|nr:TrkH family potassium uptake protein [Bacillota bacterium]